MLTSLLYLRKQRSLKGFVIAHVHLPYPNRKLWWCPVAQNLEALCYNELYWATKVTAFSLCPKHHLIKGTYWRKGFFLSICIEDDRSPLLGRLHDRGVSVWSVHQKNIAQHDRSTEELLT
jgi:hypothetical protein